MKRFPILLTVLLPLLAAAPAPATERVLAAEFPAHGLERIVLVGGDGGATIAAHDADTVLVEVRVRPRTNHVKDWLFSWFLTSRWKTNDDLVQAVAFENQESGAVLRLALTPPVRARHERIDEEWTVTLPARLALALDLNAADARVEGIEGGVEAEVNVGSLHIEVPAGDVDATMNVGDVVVRTASVSVGSVVTSANVGDTALWVDDLRIHHDDPPGPGSEVELHGRGRDTIRAVVNVGDTKVLVR
jgi:hypothetical protein